MTAQYAKLSMRTGIIVGSIDRLLHGTEFREFMAQYQMEITERLLITLMAAAIARGVPPEILGRIEAFAELVCQNDEAIAENMGRQALFDACKRTLCAAW